MKLKHGGKRSNAGRLPNFGEKLQETKAIYIEKFCTFTEN